MGIKFSVKLISLADSVARCSALVEKIMVNEFARELGKELGRATCRSPK